MLPTAPPGVKVEQGWLLLVIVNILAQHTRLMLPTAPRGVKVGQGWLLLAVDSTLAQYTGLISPLNQPNLQLETTKFKVTMAA